MPGANAVRLVAFGGVLAQQAGEGGAGLDVPGGRRRHYAAAAQDDDLIASADLVHQMRRPQDTDIPFGTEGADMVEQLRPAPDVESDGRFVEQ